MPEASTLLLYAITVLALLVVPGPAVVYIVTRSIDQGRAAGLISVAGIHVGTLVHVAAAALGLSAIITRSAVAFTTIKLAGAAYLIVLGSLRLVRGAGDTEMLAVSSSPRRIFMEAIVVNILNPKTALFFLAFMPQFIDPGRTSVVEQTIILGAIFIVLGVVSDGAYALVAGGVGSWLRRSTVVARFQRWVAGGIYVGLGITAATSGPG